MPASPSLVADIDAALLSERRQIEHFLNGRTDGHVLLEALYGAAALEPIPERMLALIRNAQRAR